MRKILSSIMLVAVAAMAFISCQKEETQAPAESKSTTLTLNANVVDTKTYITKDNAVLWGTGEYVQLYFNDGTNSQFVKSNDTYADEWNESDEAMFSFDITYTTADSYTLGGVYPASVVADSNTDATAYKVILPAVQNASSTSYDPAAFIMIMKPETIADSDFDKNGHVASFRRATALNKITLTGVKETINSVTITAEGKELAGRRKFDLTTGVEGEIYYGQTSTIMVNATYAAGDIDVWFTSWGAELAEGETLKVILKSETKTYEKTITARVEGIKFVEGALNKLTIDMSSVEGATSAVALPFEKDFSDKTGSAGLTSLEGFTISGSVYNAEGAIRLAKGSESGTVTTQELDLSEKFHVIVTACGWDSDELALTVSAGQQTTELELTTYGESQAPGEFVSYTLNFDSVSDNATISFAAASGKRIYIQKIQVLEGNIVLPSVLTAQTPEIIASAGGEGSFAYTLTNPKDGQELTATTDVDWITDINVNEGNVSYTVAENTVEEAREATITLKYEGVEDVLVTVSQAAYVDPNVVHSVTVTEFNALTGTETATYELKGTITSIYEPYDSNYGNISFYINDGAGTVLIFRMSCADGVDDPTAITVGDEITVQGKPTLYNSVIQMAAGGVCVKHTDACGAPIISFENNIVTITAEDGATIHYTTDGSDPTDGSDVYSNSIQVTDANSPMTVKAIAVADGKVQSAVASKECVWKDPNAEGEVVKGDSYEYTFTAKQWTANGDATLGSLTWTLAGDGGYWGYDATKGQQLGSGAKPYKTLTVSTTSYSGGVKTIVINTSGASSIAGVVTVTVNGVEYGSATLTKTATDYTFEAPGDMQEGEIKLTYTQTSSKAIYIKKIAIN